MELHRSKVQFHRKFGGEGRVHVFKILMALAYVPRWLAAAAGQDLLQQLSSRSQTYRRLLAELPAM